MQAIVAVYSDWGIGSDGTQPVVVRADRQHFRKVTGSSALIVGRRTVEDFPGGKPLRGRLNIVVTRSDIELDGALVVHSTEEALEAVKALPDCFVIGGASVFMQFFPYLSRVFVTKIDAEPHSDSFFPNLDNNPQWSCVEEGPWQEEDGIRYRFCVYERV